MMMPVTSILPKAEKVEQVFLESLLQIHSPAINVACPALWKALEENKHFLKIILSLYADLFFLKKKVLIEFVIILLLLFMFWIFGHKGIWDLSPLTRD